MSKKHLLGLLCTGIITSATFVACNKDNEPAPLPVKVQKLIKADWKIHDITMPSVTTPAEDSTVLKACTNDDKIIFSTSGYDFQDGAAKCDSVIFPYNKNDWNFDTVNDTLFLATGTAGKIIKWKVEELTDTDLRVKWLDSLSPTNKKLKTIKFKH